MPDELGLNAAIPVEGLLEGEDDQHAIHALLHPTQAVPLPGPELGADEPDNGHTCETEVPRESEIHIGKVDENGHVGSLLPNGSHQSPIALVDPRNVNENLSDPHHRDIFRANHTRKPSSLHLNAAQTSKVGVT